MGRVYNFSAGPAVLPEEVLKEAADEMLDYQGTGMSVMEMSHRGSTFQKILNTAEADLRELMGIPDCYKVLFLQGGASLQFAMLPMNLMKNRSADFILTGQWSKKAYQEASKYGKANVIASSEDRTFSYIPDCRDLPVSKDADYVYICENNTIYGTKYKELPDTKGKILVADVSSCFLSEPVDVTKYGVLYGGVQKNIGPAAPGLPQGSGGHAQYKAKSPPGANAAPAETVHVPPPPGAGKSPQKSCFARPNGDFSKF